MSTHVTIKKAPSGHNLKVSVLNPGQTEPTVTFLADGGETTVMVCGGSPEQAGGCITMHEVDKPAPEPIKADEVAGDAPAEKAEDAGPQS